MLLLIRRGVPKLAGKFTNLMLVLSGFLIVFYFLGLNDSGASSGLLNLLLHPENIKSNEKIVLIGTLIGSIIAAGAAALLTRSYSPEIIILASLVPMLLEFGYELIAIFNVVAHISSVLAVIVFSPILLLWVFTVLEWWRGVST